MVRGLWHVFACVTVAAASALPASGQSAGGGDAPERHGWLGVESLEGGGGTLLHLPPRGAEDGARSGAARPARVLPQTPTAVAAWDRRVSMVFAGPGDRVEAYSVRVVPVGISGAWMTEPLEGATSEPTLRLEGGAFVGAAAWADGLAVLSRDAGEGGAWRLWQLGPAGWGPIALPDEVAAGAAARLVGGCARPTVLADGAGGLQRCVLGEGADGGWSSDGLGGEPPEDWEAAVAVFDSGGDVCIVERTGTGVVARSVGPGLVGQVASVEFAGDLVGASPIEGGRRLAVLAAVVDPATPGQAEPAARWEIVEVSLVSGRELYRGPLRHPTLEIANEIRWVSLVMMGMTVCVLFYLLRPVGEGPEPALPAGYALAPPGRRMVGALIDAALMGVLVRLTLGAPIGDLVLVLPLLDTPGGMLSLAALVGGGAVYGTVAEWLWGRTLGKLLVGTRVASVDPARPRVGLMRSGARNVFRWVLAPWALFGLGSPGLRHRGDVLAGAAVVVAVRAGEGDGGADEG